MSGPAGEQRLLILGTGSIARHHAERFAQMPGCQLVAAVDTFDERARDFAAAFQIPVAFGSLAEAIAWGEFDAAVNSTPDGVHKPTTLELIAAGKPVFCEKPLALNHADALEMTEAAEAAHLVNMVNLTYRNAVRWAYNPAPAWADVAEGPNVPVERAPERITARGPSLHAPGEAGYR